MWPQSLRSMQRLGPQPSSMAPCKYQEFLTTSRTLKALVCHCGPEKEIEELWEVARDQRARAGETEDSSP